MKNKKRIEKMSTRTQIRLIENGKHYDLYHHCDGYFEGVGKQLKDALANVGKKGAKAVIRFLKETSDLFEDTNALHGDIEYFYLLDFDRDKYEGIAVDFLPWPKGTDFNSLYISPLPAEHYEKMDLVTGLVTITYMVE